MAEDGTNSDLALHARFDQGLRERVRESITPELVAEFEREPRIPSDALLRVIEYFGREPLAGKYVVVAVEPFADYRIGVLSGGAGSPVEIGEASYETSRLAKHAIFRRRARDLGVDWA